MQANIDMNRDASGMAYNTSFVDKVKIPCFHGEEHEDVQSWAEQFKTVAMMSNWNDDDAVNYAELHMRGKAQQWFCCLDKAAIPGFAALHACLVGRFGESKLTLMTRLEHWKQGCPEPVRDYVDTMHLLFVRTG